MEPITGTVKEYTFTTTNGFADQISRNGFNANVHMKVLSSKASTLLKQFIQFNLDRNFQRIQSSNRNARSYGTIILQFPDYSQFPQLSNEGPKNNGNRASINAIIKESRIIFDYQGNPSLSFTLPLNQLIPLFDTIGTPYIGYEYLPRLMKGDRTQVDIAEYLFDPMLKMRLGQAKKSMTNEEKREQINEIKGRILRVLSMIDPVKAKSTMMRDEIKRVISQYYSYLLTLTDGNRNGNGNDFITEIEPDVQTKNQDSLESKIVAKFKSSAILQETVSQLLSMEGTTNATLSILSKLFKSITNKSAARKQFETSLRTYIQSPLNQAKHTKKESMRVNVTNAIVTAFQKSADFQEMVTGLMAISLPEISPYEDIYNGVSTLFNLQDVILKLSGERATMNQSYITYVEDIYQQLVKHIKECASRKTTRAIKCNELYKILVPESNGNNASTVVPTYVMEKISSFTGNRMGKLSPTNFQEVIRIYNEMAKSLYQRSQWNVSATNKNTLIQISSILSAANGNLTVKLGSSNSASTLSTKPPSEYGNELYNNENNETIVPGSQATEPVSGGAKRKSKQREILKAKTTEQLRRMMRRAGKKCSRKGVALRKGQLISALMRS